MHNLLYPIVLISAISACLTGLGCRSGLPNNASCGYAEEPCEMPSCGYAEEPCEMPSCGLAEEPCEMPSCGLAEEPCDSIGCGDGIGCEQQSCGWIHKLLACFNLSDCAGCDEELYWSEWQNDPPGCEPCDTCGNWIGPPGVYRAPYRTLPDLATVSRTAPKNESAAEFLVPEEDFEQEELQENYSTASRLTADPSEYSEDFTPEYEQTEGEVLELSLESETIFR